MRLLHYSAKPLDAVRTTAADLRRDGSKPTGLWVSVEGDDDWKSWCEAENFSPDRLACVAEVTPTEPANLLLLSSAADVLRFHREYRCRPEFAGTGSLAADPYWDNHAIRWSDVASSYDGIIIAPYQWSLRLDGECRWYYGWDCASGCIWNADAISIKQLENV